MDRDEVERLRGMVVDQIAGLQEILDALDRELNSPADQVFDSYDDIEDDLINAADRALHD
ncbi:MAG: hypothetical protein ABR985_06200 [Methanotrichaceae archaeon]|jgi:hypothetical protein